MYSARKDWYLKYVHAANFLHSICFESDTLFFFCNISKLTIFILICAKITFHVLNPIFWNRPPITLPSPLAKRFGLNVCTHQWLIWHWDMVYSFANRFFKTCWQSSTCRLNHYLQVYIHLFLSQNITLLFRVSAFNIWWINKLIICLLFIIPLLFNILKILC